MSATSYIECAACGKRIRDTWIQVIVRDHDGEGDYQHAVGFLHGGECLLDYAASVGGLMMEDQEDT